MRNGYFENLTTEQFDQVFDVNLRGFVPGHPGSVAGAAGQRVWPAALPMASTTLASGWRDRTLFEPDLPEALPTLGDR
jgi:hypothetical protein